jgi:hypothetical protein
MPFDASKYLGKQKKKRSFRDKMRIKWYAHKKQTARKYREFEKEKEYQKLLQEKLNTSNEIVTEPEKFSWKGLFLILFIGALIVFIVYDIETKSNIIISIAILLLYGIGWLIGIALTFVVSKMFFVFLYRTSVNIASNFVVDVLEEVDKKRAKRQDSNF